MPDHDHYDVPAPEGYVSVTVAEANARMQAMCQRHSVPFGYDPEGRWYDCDMFAILRLRGICHTVYVVHDASGDYTGWHYRIVDMLTDGGPHTRAEISEPVKSWGDAILAATRKVILGDTEITESLTTRQIAALSSTIPLYAERKPA